MARLQRRQQGSSVNVIGDDTTIVFRVNMGV